MTALSSSGNVFEEIACEHEGNDIQIGFNGKFLINCVKAIDCEDVVITMLSPTKSITIEPAEVKDEEQLLYLVVPIHMH